MNKIQNNMVRNAVRKIALNEVLPYAKEMDVTGEFPWDVVNTIRKYGIMGCNISRDYGGAGLDEYAESIIIEELAYACPSVTLILDAHHISSHLFEKYASDELKERHLRDIATGEKLCCFAISEPMAGSDAQAIQSSAYLDGEEWVLNGQKTWITNFSVSDIYLIAAKNDPNKGARGISLFMVEKDAPGFFIGHKEDKMGMRGSDTGELFMEDCRIPKENLIGELGKGFYYGMEALDIGRSIIGAMSIGIIRRCLDESVKYANDTKAFGKSIGNFQGVSFKIADMRIWVEAISALSNSICEKRVNKERFTVEAASLKAFSSECAKRSADYAIQIHGGNGYSREFVPERLLRDSRVPEIMEGTTEIQKIIIGNAALSGKKFWRSENENCSMY